MPSGLFLTPDACSAVAWERTSAQTPGHPVEPVPPTLVEGVLDSAVLACISSPETRHKGETRGTGPAAPAAGGTTGQRLIQPADQLNALRFHPPAQSTAIHEPADSRRAHHSYRMHM